MGIYCVDFINNKLVWNYTISYDDGTPAGAISGITVSGDYAYIGGINGKLYCFNAQNGASGPLWNTTVLDSTPRIGLSSTPLILNNTVYVTTQTPARLLGFSYDSTNHTLTEELNISLNGSGSPLDPSVANFSSPSTDGTYIYSSGQSGIVKVDPVNKTVINTYSANGATSTPVYAEGQVYFTTTSGLYAVSAADFTEKWSNTSHQGYATAPAVASSAISPDSSAKKLVVANGPLGLTAYDAESGTFVWHNTPVDNYNLGLNLITGVGKTNKVTTVTTTSPNSPTISGNLVFYTANTKESIKEPSKNYMHAVLYGVNLSTGTFECINAYQYPATKPADTKKAMDHYLYSRWFGLAQITTSTPAVSDNLIFVGTGSVPLGSSDYSLDEYGTSFESTLTQESNANALQIRGTLNPSGSGSVIVSQSSTITPTGSETPVSEATPAGVLAAFAKLRGCTYTVNETAVTEIWHLKNAGDYHWTIQVDDSPANVFDTLNLGNRTIVFTYKNSSGTVRGTITVTAEVVTLGFNDNYNRVFSSSQKSGEIIVESPVDSTGKAIMDIEVTWSVSGSIQLSGQTENSTKYTITSGEGYITATDKRTGCAITSDRIYFRTDPIPETPVITGYSTWNGDNTRAGSLPWEGPQTNNVEKKIDFKNYPNSQSTLVDASPIIANGKVYFGIWNGGMSSADPNAALQPNPDAMGIYSYDLTTMGEIAHNKDIQIRSGMTYHKGRLYVGSVWGGGIVCLDADSLNVLSSSPKINDIGYVGLSTPLVTEVNGNTIIYAVGVTGKSAGTDLKSKTENYLYAYRDDGDKLTEIAKISGMTTKGNWGGAGKLASLSMSPDGVIYVPGCGGVFAVDTKTNKKLWTFNAGILEGVAPERGGLIGTPVYHDQCVYFTISGFYKTGGNNAEWVDGRVYCLSALDGTEKWNEPVIREGIKSTAPAVSGDRIVVGGYSGRGENQAVGIAAYYTTNGTEIWNVTSCGPLNFASPIIANDTVYHGLYKGDIFYARSLSDGSEVWRYDMNTSGDVVPGFNCLIEATPAIYDGKLYVGAENGYFYVFGPGTEMQDKNFAILGTTIVDAGVEASFTTNTTGRAYNWDFGDGTKTTGTATAVKKIWKTAGTYTVTASSGTNKAVFTVTVTEPPKAFSESEAYKNPSSVTQAAITVKPTQTPAVPDVTTEPGTNVSLIFSTKVLDSPTGTAAPAVVVEVVEYQAVTTPDAKVTLDAQKYTVPPNTEKVIFLMNVSNVQNVMQTDTGQGHRLDVMAKLVVNLTVTKDTARKISFWRYIDNNPDPVPLQSSFNFIPDTPGPITVTYTIYVPGFSTIVATVDKTAAPVIEPPKENPGGGTGGGSSSGSSYSGLSFTPINPGTGSVSYTTNHPDWPAVTFTFDRMTALGVLLASGKNVVTAERWGGVYVHSINGLSPASDSEGWMYQVNGISPGAMANSYPVQNGDKVVWYYSEDMTKPVSASKQVYAFTVSTSASVSEIAGGSAAQPGQTTKPGTIASTIVPAETKQIQVTIPDGIKVEKLDIGQKITIDTAVTKLTGTVSVNARNLIIIRPGIQITIPLADLIYNGDVATATIRGMTAEIVPVPVTIPKGGYNL